MADRAGIPISELVDVTGQCSGPDGILFASYNGDGESRIAAVVIADGVEFVGNPIDLCHLRGGQAVFHPSSDAATAAVLGSNKIVSLTPASRLSATSNQSSLKCQKETVLHL